MANIIRFALAVAAMLCVAALGPNPPNVRPANLPTYHPAIKGTLNGSDFAAWISRKATKGQTVLALAKGQYSMIRPDTSQGAYINLSNLHGVAIWMDNVKIALPDNTITAFNIDSCANLITYGPTVWWNTPGFGQATITAVESYAEGTYEVKFHLDDGYDSSSLLSNGTLNGEYTLPKTGRLQAGPGWSTFNGPVSPVDGVNNTYSFSYSDGYFIPQVGSKILSRGTFLFCNSISNSNNTFLNDFTLLNCGGFGFFSSRNRRTTFNSVVIKPAGFAPPGGTDLPARSSSADGIHSAQDFVGPTIDSCYFAELDDDCIAIHGSLEYTYESNGNSFSGSQTALTGDTLRFYSSNTFVPLGTAQVINSNTTDLNAPGEITVDQLPAGFEAGNSTYVNQNLVGSGFIIRNTHTMGNRGRGAIVKASNGVIDGNVFEGVSYPALYLGPEFSDWGEADYVHNLTITNNQIIGCSYLNKAGSAFNIHGDSDAEGSLDVDDNPVTGNSNITVSGLIITGTGSHSNIYIGAASDVRLENVQIQKALTANYTLWETTPDAVVNFQNVIFTDRADICLKNSIHQPGVEALKLYGNVTNAPTRLRRC